MVNLLVNSCEDLHFYIYLIGYPEKGESQVILIKDNVLDTVLFAGVVDCYEYQQVNKVVELLNFHNINKLNFFCWTHTDEDHSVGSSVIIDNFCDQSTQFYLPEGIYGNATDFTTYSNEIQVALDKINTFNRNQTYNVGTITLASGSSLNLDRLTRNFTDLKNKKLQFKVVALAPNSAIIRRRIENGLVKKNDTSIALMIYFGNYSAFLSGDIEDNTISQIDSGHFEYLNYLKTPHHTSTTSTKLLKKFEECFNGHKIPHVCSTVYKMHSLPDLGVVSMYKLHADAFFSTGDSSKGNTFGSITLQYNEGAQNVAQISLQGNSVQLF